MPAATEALAALIRSKSAHELAAFRAQQPLQTVPSEILVAEDRDDRC